MTGNDSGKAAARVAAGDPLAATAAPAPVLFPLPQNAPGEPESTPALAAEHGLSAEEYDRLVALLGRVPTRTELGIASVMWSEHCSYKSSRLHLRKLPVDGPQVICGPGENAGVVDIGDGQAAIFKIESHNHPSFIEPYQGAATGVGGILRDVFTMGARPVANLNALRFGDPNHPRTKHLLSGVVAGIGGYGNCIGVPTVGGECEFDPAYNGNILVNAMTVGVAAQDKVFYARAAGVGNPVVYVGAKTGRDGIHGATMASAEFSEDDDADQRPTVQVGDPFRGKLLLEACQELMSGDAIVAIQDMGAAGLTSSSVEMAGRGGLGLRLDLDAVPMREAAMSAYDIMLSESQERMLMILKPGSEPEAEAIFRKWQLDFAVVGTLTDNGMLEVLRDGRLVAALPVAPLVDQAPLYDRPFEPTPPAAPLPAILPAHPDAAEALARLVGGPRLASKRWIFEQYDFQVGADTVFGPGTADAGLVRVHGTRKGLAVTTDCTPRYCQADPFTGGAQAVAEAWRNLVTVGADPLAWTNNLNFGNPQKPRIMGQLVGCIEGMAAAGRALSFPVVSGNVSLYNETDGRAILPTPVIGGVGLVPDTSRAVAMALPAGAVLLLVGETKGHLGQSLYLRDILGLAEGPPPPVDLAAELAAGQAVLAQIRAGTVLAAHDLADGGLLCALAEMAMAGGCGAEVTLPAETPEFLFGEDQGRYLLAVPEVAVALVTAALTAAAVPAVKLGTAGGDALIVGGRSFGKVAALAAANEAWLPGLMAR